MQAYETHGYEEEVRPQAFYQSNKICICTCFPRPLIPLMALSGMTKKYGPKVLNPTKCIHSFPMFSPGVRDQRMWLRKGSVAPNFQRIEKMCLFVFFSRLWTSMLTLWTVTTHGKSGPKLSDPWLQSEFICDLCRSLRKKRRSGQRSFSPTRMPKQFSPATLTLFFCFHHFEKNFF